MRSSVCWRGRLAREPRTYPLHRISWCDWILERLRAADVWCCGDQGGYSRASDEVRMTMIDSAFPIISTADLPRLLAFYVERLGGVATYRFNDVGDPVFVSLDLGSSHLGLGADPALAGSAPSPRFSLWVYVDDCDATVERLREVATVIEEPVSQPWGERVAKVLDPDGNLIVVGQRGAPPADTG